MPKIAQYQPDQVTTQVVSQPRAQAAPAGAFDSPIVQGVLDIAKSAAAFKQRIDTTSAEEALVNFERDKNELFFNPDSGYFNSQGRDAYDNSDAANKALDDLKKQYGENLGVQSKAMFDKSANQHITRSQMEIARHASKGLKAWEIGTIDAQVENTVENASLYWDDPEKLKVQNVLGRQAIFDSAKLSGASFEATAEKVQTYDSAFARATVTAAAANSSDAGKMSLEKYGDRLEGPDKIKMEGLIEKKAKTEKTQGDARMATLTATRLTDQYESRSDVMTEVNKIKDPELRKETMTQSMSLFSRKEQAKKELSNDFYQDSIKLVNEGLSPTEMKAQDPVAWLGMSDTQRNNILSGKHMITDQVLLSKLRSLPVKEKSKLNAVDYAADLKPSDLQKLTGEINAAKKGNPGSRVKSLSSKAMQAAEGAFGKKSKWSNRGGKQNAKGQRANEFLGDLQDAIDDFEDVNQRKITPAEEDKLIGEFTRQIVVERSAFGFDFLAADIELDLSNTPPEDVRVLNRIISNTDNIDVKDLTEAYQFLIDNNQSITPKNLSNVYKQGRQ